MQKTFANAHSERDFTSVHPFTMQVRFTLPPNVLILMMFVKIFDLVLRKRALFTFRLDWLKDFLPLCFIPPDTSAQVLLLARTLSTPSPTPHRPDPPHSTNKDEILSIKFLFDRQYVPQMSRLSLRVTASCRKRQALPPANLTVHKLNTPCQEHSAQQLAQHHN